MKALDQCYLKLKLFFKSDFCALHHSHLKLSVKKAFAEKLRMKIADGAMYMHAYGKQELQINCCYLARRLSFRAAI